jgi:hypothetical protein
VVVTDFWVCQFSASFFVVVTRIVLSHDSVTLASFSYNNNLQLFSALCRAVMGVLCLTENKINETVRFFRCRGSTRSCCAVAAVVMSSFITSPGKPREAVEEVVARLPAFPVELDIPPSAAVTQSYAIVDATDEFPQAVRDHFTA